MPLIALHTTATMRCDACGTEVTVIINNDLAEVRVQCPGCPGWHVIKRTVISNTPIRIPLESAPPAPGGGGGGGA